MTEYTGNAHRQKEGVPDREPPEKIVTGTVIQKKKSFGQRFKGIFFGGEFKNAVRFVSADVILPAIRSLFVDATTRGVERVVYGESQAQRRRPITYGSRISYNHPVERGRAYLPDQPSRPIGRQARKETNDLILANREEAEEVIERLTDIIDKYQVASVSDLMHLIGHPSSPVDNKWGWVDLTNTEIRQVKEGYLIDLPHAEEI